MRRVKINKVILDENTILCEQCGGVVKKRYKVFKCECGWKVSLRGVSPRKIKFCKICGIEAKGHGYCEEHLNEYLVNIVRKWRHGKGKEKYDKWSLGRKWKKPNCIRITV